MSGVTKKLISASGGVAGGEFTAIEDVFSCFLYTGNGATQAITNGIDLAGEGGLVWIKSRTTGAFPVLHDTERGALKYLTTNTTDAEDTDTDSVTSFNSDGFSMGGDTWTNFGGANYASWTFRKAPRFFDVVTYTGTSVVGNQIPHNLGVVPGCIIIKRTNSSTDWMVYHRGVDALNPANYYLTLNGPDRAYETSSPFNNTAPTSTHFTVGIGSNTNSDGATYVAYLFAHDPLGPSGDGSDGLIDCGSYTGNGSADGPEINLGWEPQWVMVKRTDSTGLWYILDSMRGISSGITNGDQQLFANASAGESADNYLALQPKGFKVETAAASGFNASGGNFIYIAIRRGPMRAPESGTEVFQPYVTTSVSPSGSTTFSTTSDVGFPVDWVLQRNKSGTDGWYAGARLTGNKYLKTETTGAELTSGGLWWDSNIGAWNYSASFGTYNFRRAPEFFDVVAYTGNGTAGRTVPHNLGVAPEMMIVKSRNQTYGGFVYHAGIGEEKALILFNGIYNVNAAATYLSWNNTAPSSSFFTLGNFTNVNASNDTLIAYLFATLAGVSKVGSYTGNGSSQTINCGFTTGARFILIKRTDSTGDWYVWDTARGIVAGNDPFLELNTTDAEVTSDDSIDPDSSGFIVNQTGTTNVNVSSASYIFYAIA